MVKIIVSPKDAEKTATLFEDSDFKRENNTFISEDPEEASAIAELILEENEVAYRLENGKTKAVYMPEEGFFEFEIDEEYLSVLEKFEEYCKV